MGAVIPQVITSDRASGAQVIDGSLQFNGTDQYLTRTPGESGNRTTWTWSGWFKRDENGVNDDIFTVPGSSNKATQFTIMIHNGNYVSIDYGGAFYLKTNRLIRDTLSWYHFVVTVDTTLSNADDRIRLYINGIQETSFATRNNPSQHEELGVNRTAAHTISSTSTSGFTGPLSNLYLIDGQALTPDSFGFTDPLTNTWRPKKFSGNFVINADGFGVRYSNFGSGTVNGTRTYDKAFDGSTSTFCEPADNQTITFDFTSLPGGGIAVSSSLRMYLNKAGTPAAGHFTVNGTNLGGSVPSGAYLTIGSVSRLDTITFYHASGSSSVELYAVEVDGTILIDFEGTNSFYFPLDGTSPINEDKSGNGNDFALKNFVGSVALDNPLVSGARPILNTTQGGAQAGVGVFGNKENKYYTLTGSTNSSDGFVFENEGTKPTLSVIRGATYEFDFTAASSHPLYLSSLNDGKHNSKAYSVQFDGTDDYLSLASSSDFALGTNDWTVEYFAYCESTTAYQRHFYLIGSTAGQIEGIYADSNGISFGRTAVFGETAVPNPLNQWNHYALVHDSTSMRLYINGSQVISTTNNFVDEDKSLHIGYSSSTFGGYFDGYISNFRVLKGTALYTSSFTPPQTTLTNITNTKLLCCQDSDATTAVVTPGTITTNGGAAATNSYSPFVYDNNHDNFGLNTDTSNINKITVPHLAADTLYYYCHNHSGMGNSISVTTDETKTDLYAWKNILALPLVGNDDDESNKINCTSTVKAITANGDPSASLVRSNFYNSSYHFDGTGDYLSVGTASDFELGIQDFTIEMWLNMDATSTLCATFFSKGNTTSIGTEFLSVQTTSSNTTVGFFFGSGSALLSTTEFNLDTWHHVAVTRSGNTFRLFIDGDQKTSTTSSHSLATGVTAGVNVAAQSYDVSADTRKYNGYMQDLRVYKGVAKYTSSFVVASTSPDIIRDTPSGVSGGSKLTKITQGSVGFDGSDDYLSISDHADWDIGTNAFTIECFVNINSASTDYSGIFGMHTGSVQFQFRINAEGRIQFLQDFGGTRGNTNDTDTSGTNLRDNRWHHVAVTRQSDNTWQLYVDGKVNYSGTGMTGDVTGINEVAIGRRADSDSHYLTGFISNLRFISGTAIYSSDFTPPTEPLTNVTNTILLCCQTPSFATTAAVIPPSSFSAHGTPAPTYGATTFNPFNYDINTVRGQESGVCTLNPLDTTLSTTNLTDGNLRAVGSSNWAVAHARGNFKMTSGKWYWEGTKNGGSGAILQFGFANKTASLAQAYGSAGADSWTFYFGNGTEIIVPAANSSGYFTGSAMTDGETAGIALDMDNGTWQFFKNGIAGAQKTLVSTDSGSTASITELYPYVGAYNSNIDMNFGQKPFKFPPPDGFQPLNVANLKPDTTGGSNPLRYVDVVTWSGQGNTNERTIATSFKPDLIWSKARSFAYHNNWFDSVRGFGATNALVSDSNGAAGAASGGRVKSVSDTGITWEETGGTYAAAWYNESYDYISWAWKAGGSAGTWNKDDVAYASAAAAGLTGTTSPATLVGASIGTKQGFSIIRWNRGADYPAWSTGVIPHGLTQAPNMIITKNLGTGHGWMVFHSGKGIGRLYLESTGSGDTSGYTVLPTATHFTIDSTSDGDSSDDCISYCWHDVPGLQKFGKYIGDASIPGPYVELGFRPAIVMVKRSTGAAANWYIMDKKIQPVNPVQHALEPNTADITNTAVVVNYDFLSNGFKLYGTDGDINASGSEYVYAAWAEAPSFNLFGAQSNAR